MNFFKEWIARHDLTQPPGPPTMLTARVSARMSRTLRQHHSFFKATLYGVRGLKSS